MTITSIVQDAKLQSMGKQYKNWFDVAKKKVQNSNMTLDEKTKLMEHLWNAEQIVADTKLKDVTHKPQRDNIVEYLIKNQGIDTKVSEIKAEIEKHIFNYEEKIQQEVTKRWESDMQSDNWLSKSVRPLSLLFLLFVLTIFTLVDFSFIDLEIKDSWIDLWQLLAITAFGAYFGGRSYEKIKRK